MSGTSKKIITLDRESDPIVINDITIKFNTNGGVDIYGNFPVTICAPANDDATAPVKKELEVGDKMEDGTIFAGISPDTGGA